MLASSTMTRSPHRPFADTALAPADLPPAPRVAEAIHAPACASRFHASIGHTFIARYGLLPPRRSVRQRK